MANGNGSSNAYYVDWKQAGAAASEVQGELNKFKEKVEELTAQIVDLNESWKGQTYDAFKVNYDTYKTNTINAIISTMEQWIKSLEEAANLAEQNSIHNTRMFQ